MRLVDARFQARRHQPVDLADLREEVEALLRHLLRRLRRGRAPRRRTAGSRPPSPPPARAPRTPKTAARRAAGEPRAPARARRDRRGRVSRSACRRRSPRAGIPTPAPPRNPARLRRPGPLHRRCSNAPPPSRRGSRRRRRPRRGQPSPAASTRTPSGGARNASWPAASGSSRGIAGELHEAERGAGRPHQRIARVRATEAMAEIERGEEIAGAVGRGLDGAVRNQLRATRRDEKVPGLALPGEGRGHHDFRPSERPRRFDQVGVVGHAGKVAAGEERQLEAVRRQDVGLLRQPADGIPRVLVDVETPAVADHRVAEDQRRWTGLRLAGRGARPRPRPEPHCRSIR